MEIKRATTVEEQIAKLSERGMIIVDKAKAKEILSDIGYFRLGFYCFPFEISYPSKSDRIHKYRIGSDFKNVVDLYYLDCKLRNVLHECLNRIEVNFRTNIIYRVSNRYKDKPTWFVDTAVMDRDFVGSFDAEIYSDKFKTSNNIIRNHHKKYINDKYAPAWKTLEFVTFGAMLKLYKSIRNEDLKHQIAMQYNIPNKRTFENYFGAIVEIRNLCAHGRTLFDHRLAKPLIGSRILKVTDNNKNRVISVIKVMELILMTISSERAKEFKIQVDRIFKMYTEIPIIGSIIK